MKNHIKKIIKNHRLKVIKKIQNDITTKKAMSMIDKVVEVLVDSFDSQNGEFIAHSQNLSPLVDFGVRFVDNGNVKENTFVNVRIYDFDGSDFKGEVV